jgi:transcription termination factor NusB
MFLWLAELGARQIEKPVLSHEQIEVLKDFYARDIERFQKISGLDLNRWRAYTTT